LVVPGILQTEEYARTVARDIGPGSLKLDQAHAFVEIKMIRQKEVLRRPISPPRVIAVIDESVIRRPVGGAGAMARQLRHLIAIARMPNVEIQIVPFRLGVHPGLRGPFTILRFFDPSDPEVLYLEHAGGDMMSREEPHVVDEYRTDFEKLRRISMPPEASAALIEGLARESQKPTVVASAG
jgi:hypothetical protein